MTSILLVPYHIDERLPFDAIPLPPNVSAAPVTKELRGDDPWERMARLHREVAETVKQASRPVTVVSGDCMVSMATVAGTQHAGEDPAVVWFDAHGDVHVPESTASGYLGGMPLRLIAGYRRDLIADAIGLRTVDEDRLMLVDGRDLDPPEVEYLDSSRIRRSSVAGLDAASLPDGPIVLHIDVDVVDSAEVDNLRFPVTPGPTTAEVVAAARRVLATGRVIALDIGCTWYPDGDPAGRAQLLTELLDDGNHP